MVLQKNVLLQVGLAVIANSKLLKDKGICGGKKIGAISSFYAGKKSFPES